MTTKVPPFCVGEDGPCGRFACRSAENSGETSGSSGDETAGVFLQKTTCDNRCGNDRPDLSYRIRSGHTEQLPPAGAVHDWSTKQAQMLDRIRKLEEEKRWYQRIVAGLGDGLTVQDRNFIILYQNKAHQDLMGDHRGEICFQAYAGRSSICPECYLKVTMETGTSCTVERTVGSGESALFYEITISPLTDDREEVVAGVEVVRDITERKRAETKLKYMSCHDALTGLYNRAFFEQELKRLAGGRSYPISIIIADVDDLKVINDTKGHAAGDELLKRSAMLLRELFRAEDVVARIGGDEFAILLPETDARTAEESLARIRALLHDWNSSYHYLINLSLGSGTAGNEQEVRQALKHADETMYLDKISRTGRSPRRNT